MEFMKYELAQARINELKALRHPQQRQETAGFSFQDALAGWWQAFRAPAAKAKVAAAYRAELMRQEWMVNSEPANKI